MSSPLIAYFGHHKCGTVWITSIFNEACNAVGLKTKHAHEPGMFGNDIETSRRIAGFDALTYTNANYRYVEAVDVIGFHVVRDPRDIIVSGYFSHLHSHPDNVWPELRIFRRLLRSLDKSAGLMMEMEFAADWMADLRSWPDAVPSVLLVRFEEMVWDPHASFRRIFEHLGLLGRGLSTTRLQEIIDAFSFERLSKGRIPGEEDVGHHFRKGVPGDWVNHFSPAHVWMFKRRYNDLLVKYGYESGIQWEGKPTAEVSLTAAQQRQLAKRGWVSALRHWRERWA